MKISISIIDLVIIKVLQYIDTPAFHLIHCFGRLILKKKCRFVFTNKPLTLNRYAVSTENDKIVYYSISRVKTENQKFEWVNFKWEDCD